MKAFFPRFLLVGFLSVLSSILFAQGETEQQATNQLTSLLKLYLKPASRALAGLDGNFVPFMAYIKVNGGVGHYDLEGGEPTDDFRVVDNMVGLLYEKIYSKRDDYLAFIIFAVTEVEHNGKKEKVMTAIMEHRIGLAAQKVWPFELSEGQLRLLKSRDIPAVNVIFSE
jgi:hypothetical protein